MYIVHYSVHEQYFMFFNYPKELNHLASRNQQPLLDVYLFSLRAHFNVGVSITELYLASGSYFRAMEVIYSNPTILANRTSRWTND